MPKEGIQKGYLFCQTWYIKGKGVGPRGGASPFKILVSSPALVGVVGSVNQYSEDEGTAFALHMARPSRGLDDKTRCVAIPSPSRRTKNSILNWNLHVNKLKLK